MTPEQLAAGVEAAEAAGHRVVGWYHSHPHITALPSHVDVRTQAARVRRAEISQTGRGGAAAATWIFRGDESRHRRGGGADLR